MDDLGIYYKPEARVVSFCLSEDKGSTLIHSTIMKLLLLRSHGPHAIRPVNPKTMDKLVGNYIFNDLYNPSRYKVIELHRL
jgi:hypothetical protein